MHVLLTGASSGIGEAYALAMGKRGWNLTLVARRADELKRVAAQIAAPAKVQTISYDLSQLDGVAGLVKQAEDGLGPVDVLVNNAGIERISWFTDVSIEEGEKLLRVNLLAPMRLIQTVAPAMIARKSGHIVNVTSVAGLAPLPYGTHYSASKAALSSASEHLRLELGAKGVKVCTVYPGPIVTAMGERAAASYARDALPRFLWGGVEGLAEATLGAMDGDCARLIYPRMYTIVKWFPGISRYVQFKFAPLPGKRS